MDADGVCPQDGAAIEAQEGELGRYTSAIHDPRNKVNHLEVVTNDEARCCTGVPSRVRRRVAAAPERPSPRTRKGKLRHDRRRTKSLQDKMS
ncbi:hypothetical protein ACFTZI_01790 [Streptomyces decoyicus]|uniref:hypothetical protein n=1 Tax=Streptomyces decoyicus TaxID=249567 RepID=UPI00362F2C7F